VLNGYRTFRLECHCRGILESRYSHAEGDSYAFISVRGRDAHYSRSADRWSCTTSCSPRWYYNYAERVRLASKLKHHFRKLERAKNIAIKAIEGLPETPLSAAGFNIRIKLDDPPNSFCGLRKLLWINYSRMPVFNIKTWSTNRSIEYGNGLLNLRIHQNDIQR
jgi:hypothetical protein